MERGTGTAVLHLRLVVDSHTRGDIQDGEFVTEKIF